MIYSSAHTNLEFLVYTIRIQNSVGQKVLIHFLEGSAAHRLILTCIKCDYIRIKSTINDKNESLWYKRNKALEIKGKCCYRKLISLVVLKVTQSLIITLEQHHTQRVQFLTH